MHGGYDTHENQIHDLDNGNFPELDDALDGFFAALTNAQDVVVMIWTEFGRRAASNNGGTDHGRPNNVVLAGPRVNGGLYGAQPSLADAALDGDGNLVGSVEFGSVYTDVITNFLGGDAATILGATYPTIGAES